MLLHLNLHSSDGFPIRFHTQDLTDEDCSVKISCRDAKSIIVKDVWDKNHTIGKQAASGAKIQHFHFVTFELDVPEDDDELLEKGTSQDVDFKNQDISIHVLVQKECVGVTRLSSKQLLSCSGSLVLTMLCPTSLKFIATVALDYVKIKPWNDEDLCPGSDRQECFDSLHFKYIGHRGFGKTVDRKMHILENTIASFLKAHQMGAQLVELDIQITKDKVPVIFHDFSASVQATTKQEKDEWNPVFVPVQELTFDQVRNLKFFEKTPEELGVQIEVKFPYKDGVTREMEIDHYFTRNEVVDLVLDEVMKYKGDRKICFGSFDADVCLMLHYKQSKYPVMLITSGENDQYFYADIRNQTRGIAAQFAVAHNLMEQGTSQDVDVNNQGISVYADALLAKLDEIRGLAMFLDQNQKHIISWGSMNSDRSFVAVQKDSGFSAVISDHLDKLGIPK